MKVEALDRTLWRTRFGRGYGPVVRQTAKWMNEWMNKTIYQLLKMILYHNISLLTSGFKEEWLLYVPPVLILKLHIYPTECICGFTRLSELTPLISLNNINQLVFVMERKCFLLRENWTFTKHNLHTWYDMIYLLTAIGLSPGGRSTVHIYTQTIHRTIRNKQYIEQHNNFGRVRAVPRLG